MGRRRRHVLLTVGGVVPALVWAASPTAGAPIAASPPPISAPAPVGPEVAAKATISRTLQAATGPGDLVVRLSQPSLAESVARDAVRTKALPTADAQRAAVAAASAQQDQVAAAAQAAAGATEVGRVDVALNALVVHLDDLGKAGTAPRLPGVVPVERAGVAHVADAPAEPTAADEAAAAPGTTTTTPGAPAPAAPGTTTTTPAAAAPAASRTATAPDDTAPAPAPPPPPPPPTTPTPPPPPPPPPGPPPTTTTTPAAAE